MICKGGFWRMEGWKNNMHHFWCNNSLKRKIVGKTLVYTRLFGIKMAGISVNFRSKVEYRVPS